MKYSLSPQEIPRLSPSGFLTGSGYISLYIPPLITIQISARWSIGRHYSANIYYFFSLYSHRKLTCGTCCIHYTSHCQNAMKHYKCYLLTISGQHEHQATNAHKADCRSCTQSAHVEGSIATRDRMDMWVALIPLSTPAYSRQRVGLN